MNAGNVQEAASNGVSMLQVVLLTASLKRTEERILVVQSESPHCVAEERRFLLLELRCMVKNLRQVIATLFFAFGSFSVDGDVLVDSVFTVPAADDRLKRLGRRFTDFFSGTVGVGAGELEAGDSSCSSGK